MGDGDCAPQASYERSVYIDTTQPHMHITSLHAHMPYGERPHSWSSQVRTTFYT